MKPNKYTRKQTERAVFRETGTVGDTVFIEPVLGVDWFVCDHRKKCRVSRNCVINGGPCSHTTDGDHDAERR